MTCTPAGQTSEIPLVSVVVLNYNGARWLDRCLSTLHEQTILDQLEVVVADNASIDGSDLLAVKLMEGWPNGRVIQHGSNLGFCEGNNRAAAHVRGKYLFFLNNDTWLEPRCLETLVRTTEKLGAEAAQPLIIDYEDDASLCPTGEGFDVFGLLSLGSAGKEARTVFVVGGCSYLIRRDLFLRLGGFDPAFFMYVDEFDLSWRAWLSGARSILVPGARLHHRGAVEVNPEGGTRIVELRTSESKRYYANRNGLLMLLKNCQHILLVMVVLQLAYLVIEGCAACLLVRQWSFIKRAYLGAVWDCWKQRAHIRVERQRIRTYRKRSDWWMLRFLRWRLNRWHELRNFLRHGMPKISNR